MTVTVRMHGNLRRFLPEGRESVALEVEETTTVEDVLAVLRAGHDTWLVVVNGAVVGPSSPLHTGDLVECYEPVAGG